MGVIMSLCCDAARRCVEQDEEGSDVGLRHPAGVAQALDASDGEQHQVEAECIYEVPVSAFACQAMQESPFRS